MHYIYILYINVVHNVSMRRGIIIIVGIIMVMP